MKAVRDEEAEVCDDWPSDEVKEEERIVEWQGSVRCGDMSGLGAWVTAEGYRVEVLRQVL